MVTNRSMIKPLVNIPLADKQSAGKTLVGKLRTREPLTGKARGFTLVELLIVIAIMGILASIAYPAYTSAVKKANRADGIDSLVSLAGRMEEYYMSNDTYNGATVTAAGDGTVGSNTTSDGLYTMSISEATAFKYKLTATPVSTDADCSTLTLTSLGEKGSTGNRAANADCW